MKKTLIIGAGAVGTVTVHKCAQFPEIFGEICLASRTLKKCQDIADQLTRPIQVARLDAHNVADCTRLIQTFKADIVINVALPYQNLAIMDACLAAGVDYIDTACYEDPKAKGFSYKQQWEYHDRFKAKGIMALLGAGFDPGITNVFVKYAATHHFDQIKFLDILDCNGGDHGLPFATNFNPEINLRELDAPGAYYQNNNWVEIPSLSNHQPFNFPEVGNKEMYIVYHEELETITKHIPGIERARFWMTFGQSYINHLNAFTNVGLTGIEPVEFQGNQIVPIEFLKSLLPDPITLGPLTKGKTNIGCLMQGIKDGKEKSLYVYQICDHQETYKEVGMQAVAYTAGVPPAITAALMLTNKWREPGVFNTEQLNPMPFLEIMSQFGLPWQEVDGSAYTV